MEFPNNDESSQVEFLEMPNDGEDDATMMEAQHQLPAPASFWSAGRIDALLRCRFDMHSQFESSATKKTLLWQRIAQRLSEADGGESEPISAVACAVKFKNLYSTYRTIKARADHVDPRGCSTFRGTRWPFYDRFECSAIGGARLVATISPRRSRSYFYEFCSDVLKTFPEPPRGDRKLRRKPMATPALPTPESPASAPLRWTDAMVDWLVELRLQRHGAFLSGAGREHGWLWQEIAGEIQQRMLIDTAYSSTAALVVIGIECYRKYRLLLKSYRRHMLTTDGHSWRYWNDFHAVYATGDQTSAQQPSLPADAEHHAVETNNTQLTSSSSAIATATIESISSDATNNATSNRTQKSEEVPFQQSRWRPCRWTSPIDRRTLALAHARFRHERQQQLAMLRVRRQQVRVLSRIADALEVANNWQQSGFVSS